MVLLLSGRYAVLVVLSIEVRGSDVKDFSRDLLSRDLLLFQLIAVLLLWAMVLTLFVALGVIFVTVVLL